jgi:hypothetical protein
MTACYRLQPWFSLHAREDVRLAGRRPPCWSLDWYANRILRGRIASPKFAKYPVSRACEDGERLSGDPRLIAELPSAGG